MAVKQSRRRAPANTNMSIKDKPQPKNTTVRALAEKVRSNTSDKLKTKIASQSGKGTVSAKDKAKLKNANIRESVPTQSSYTNGNGSGNTPKGTPSQKAMPVEQGKLDLRGGYTNRQAKIKLSPPTPSSTPTKDAIAAGRGTIAGLALGAGLNAVERTSNMLVNFDTKVAGGKAMAANQKGKTVLDKQVGDYKAPPKSFPQGEKKPVSAPQAPTKVKASPVEDAPSKQEIANAKTAVLPPLRAPKQAPAIKQAKTDTQIVAERKANVTAPVKKKTATSDYKPQYESTGAKLGAKVNTTYSGIGKEDVRKYKATAEKIRRRESSLKVLNDWNG